jgi:hypothetical protein
MSVRFSLRPIALILLLWSLPMRPGHSQTPDRVALANRLLDAMRFGVEAERSLAKVKSMGDSTQGTVANAMGALVRRFANPAEHRQKMAAGYLAEFSDDELRQLIGFYESPLGQRLLDAQSRVLAENRADITKNMRGPLEELRNKIRGDPPPDEPWR